MKKAEFLAMVQEQLTHLSDDDEVLIELDGGEYWGKYMAHPKLEVKEVTLPENGVWVGHPGVPGKNYCSHPSMIAVFKDA